MKSVCSSIFKAVITVFSSITLLSPINSNAQDSNRIDLNGLDLNEDEVSALNCLSDNRSIILSPSNSINLDEHKIHSAVLKVVDKLKSKSPGESNDDILKKLLEQMKYDNYKIFHKNAEEAQGMGFENRPS